MTKRKPEPCPIHGPRGYRVVSCNTCPPPRPASKKLAAHIVTLLNEAMALDAVAVQELVDHRVPCSKPMAAHPEIQCGTRRRRRGHCYTVGVLGLLNGLVGVDANGWGIIAAVYETSRGGDGTERRVLHHFEVRS